MINKSKIIIVLLSCCILLAACTTSQKVVHVEEKREGLTINDYPITFNPDGGTIRPEELESSIESSKVSTTVYLPQAEKEHFVFMGWKNGDKNYFTINASEVKSSLNLVAQWEAIKYPINYDLTGYVNNDIVEEAKKEVEVKKEEVKEEKKSNPNDYTVLDSFSLINPERKGFEFVGWKEKGTQNEPLATYTIKEGTSGEKDLEAVWSRNTYLINYDLNDGKLQSENTSSYLFDSDAILLNEPVRDYYYFVGWKDIDSGTIYIDKFDDTDIARNVTLKAIWEPIEYKITIDYDGGKANNPEFYTYESETFTLNVPTKSGYTFMGWGEETETLVVNSDPELFRFTSSIGDISLILSVHSNYAEIIYPRNTLDSFINSNVEYLEERFPTFSFTKNGTIITVTFNSIDSKLEEAFSSLIKDLNIVVEYTELKKDLKTYSDVTIEKGSHRDRSFVALWKIINYSLSYGEDEVYKEKLPVKEPDPKLYTVEETLSIENRTKFGYDFVGWLLNGDDDYNNAVADLVIEKGSTGDRLYTPLFKIHNYKCDILLDGGEFVNEVNYPETFTIYDDVFRVDSEPTRDNYIFSGWMVNDRLYDSVLVDPSKGEDITIKAVWTPIVYGISYDLNGGNYPKESKENPTIYTVETENFELTNPVKDMYVFSGWVESDREDKDYPVVNMTFDSSIGKDISLKATWTERVYNISYDLDGGSFEYSDTNPSYYTNFMDEITLINPTRPGYTFLGFVEEGHINNKPNTNYVINTIDERRDISLVALWEPTKYSISYSLNGGNYIRGVGKNRTEYTLLTTPFNLVDVERKGYKFLGWVNSDSSDVDLPVVGLSVDTSKCEDLSFSALWEAEVYSISYNLDGGEYSYGNSNPTQYTIDSSFTFSNPKKDGYTFLGWVVSGDSSETIRENLSLTPGMTGDIALYAIFENNLGKTGEATKEQKANMVYGKDGIARPDWVISPVDDETYHYERAYYQGSDIVESIEEAKEKCLKYFTQYLYSQLDYSSKDVNGVVLNSSTINYSSELRNVEMVEYWEDGVGGVWVLMRISK